MRFKLVPVSRRQVAVCIALIFRSFVKRYLYVSLAVKEMSDTAEGNGSRSGFRTAEEIVLHYERFAFGTVGGNKNSSRSGVSSGLPELSCCCSSTLSCIDGRSRGAFHTKFGQARYLRTLVLSRSYRSFTQLEPR